MDGHRDVLERNAAPPLPILCAKESQTSIESVRLRSSIATIYLFGRVSFELPCGCLNVYTSVALVVRIVAGVTVA